MSSILSDFNRNENIASPVSRKKLYSDLSLTFAINPLTKDISPITDIEAVKNSIKNLIFTNFYERPFNPSLGSGLTALLFEPADMFTEIELKSAISKVINNHEPRVSQLRVDVTDLSERNAYHVTVLFVISSSDQINEVEFFLTRLR